MIGGRASRMWLAAAGAALVGLSIGACGRGESADSRAVDFEHVPAKLADGERLFNTFCARCHGAQAMGTEQGPPLIHPFYERRHHADEAFQRAVALGVVAHHWRFGPMPRIEGVTQLDVAKITAYVRWLQHQAGID